MDVELKRYDDLKQELMQLLLCEKHLTLVEVLWWYFEKHGTDIPDCGYKDVFLLIRSMFPFLEITYTPENIPCVRANANYINSNPAIVQPCKRQLINEIAKPGIKDTCKQPLITHETAPLAINNLKEKEQLEAVKSDIRCISIIIGHEALSSCEIVDQYKLNFGTDMPLCGFKNEYDLLHHIPDVLCLDPKTGRFKVVPTEKTKNLGNVIKKTVANNRRKCKSLDPTRLKNIGVRLGSSSHLK